MAVLIVELFVAIIRHLQNALLNTECVSKVLSERMSCDFYCPTGKVFSIEE
jgi:hypothetical protein